MPPGSRTTAAPGAEQVPYISMPASRANYGAAEEAANRVRLPAGGLYEFLQGGAGRSLQQDEHLGRFTGAPHT